MPPRNVRMPVAQVIPSSPRATYPVRSNTADSGLSIATGYRTQRQPQDYESDSDNSGRGGIIDTESDFVQSPEDDLDITFLPHQIFSPTSDDIVGGPFPRPVYPARDDRGQYDDASDEDDVVRQQQTNRAAAAVLSRYLSLPPVSDEDQLPELMEQSRGTSNRGRMVVDSRGASSFRPRPGNNQRQADSRPVRDERNPQRGLSGLVKKAVRTISRDDTTRIPTKKNDVASVARGIVCSTNYKHELTILLVGETGVGKTSVLTWFFNTLQGLSPDKYNLEVRNARNEAGGSAKHSQTNEAQIYTLRSVNGFTVTILDTPGLADTRGIAQDEMHKKSIGDAIKNGIPAIDAVLILANGTVPRLTVSTNYALTTLASIFPRKIADNIGILITNVPSELNCNFEAESLPDSLAKAPLFMLDNPVSLEGRFRKNQRHPRMQANAHRAVQAGHDKALHVFVDLLDWLDQRALQPTKDIVSLYEQVSQIEQNISEALAILKQAQSKQSELAHCMTLIQQARLDMATYHQVQNTITRRTWEQPATRKKNTICTMPDCYSNCHMSCNMQFSFQRYRFKLCSAFGHGKSSNCRVCGHHYSMHNHVKAHWELTDVVSVNQDARQRFEGARSEQEQKEALRAQVTAEIAAMKTSMRVGMEQIRRLVESYANISLSGSFSVQIERSVDMLVMTRDTIRKEGGDESTIMSLGETIGRLQAKLEVVRDACSVTSSNDKYI